MDTDKYLKQVYDWLITFGPKVLIGIIILIAGLWLINFISKLIANTLAKKDFDATLRSFLTSMIVIILRVFLILAIMQIIGIQMTIFAAILGAFGVAVGLALSGTLQNFTSGILILLFKPFKVGDNIITQGQEGKVTSIQIFYTMVTTFDNMLIIIPNIKLTSEPIINISREGKRRMDLSLKFNYAMEIDQLKEIIRSTVPHFETIVKDMEIRIGVSAIEADGFKVMVNLWVIPHGFEDTKLAFQEQLVKNIKNAGIKLAGM